MNMYKLALFTVLLFTLSQMSIGTPSTLQGTEVNASKTIVNGREANPRKLPSIPPGSSVKVIIDQNTGVPTVVIESTGSPHKNSGAKTPARNKTSGSVQPLASNTSPTDGGVSPSEVMESLNRLDEFNQGVVSPTAEVQGADGRIYYTTTLTFGTLTVSVPKDKVRADREIRLNASLTLNPIIPQEIQKVGKKWQGGWFIVADYIPQNGPEFLGAVAETPLQQPIPEVSGELVWRWKVHLRSGFRRDEAEIKLNVLYKASDSKTEPPVSIGSREVVWVEDDSVWWWEEFKKFSKDILPVIFTGLAILIPLAISRHRLKAETIKAVAEAETARLELAKARESFAHNADSDSFYREFLSKEILQLRGTLKVLEAESKELRNEIERLEESNKRLKTANMGLITKTLRLKYQHKRNYNR